MRQFFFSTTVFISSACGLIIEIVAGRLIAPYVGMSLYTWTAIIAVVLAGLSVGHWIGGLLAAPSVDTRMGARRVGWALMASAISSLAILLLLRTIAALLMPSGLGLIPIIILLTTAVFFLPSLFVGIVSPILTKLAVDEDDTGNPGRVIGRMYALGTLGSILGTMVAGYILLSWIGSVGTVLIVSAIYAFLAFLFLVLDRSRWMALPVLILSVGAIGFWGERVQAFKSPCTTESDYFCIRIDEARSFGPSARLMALDHLVHSINDRDTPSLLYSPYIHFVDEYAKARLGNRVPTAYFIGGGGFSLPRAWADEFDGKALLTVAEIDPAVTKAAADILWLDPEAPGLDIIHQDARRHIQSLPDQATFDMIFGDAFHDISIPQHLVSREFHQSIASRLKADGFYAINVVDNSRDPRFLMALVKTLRQDFGAVEVWFEYDGSEPRGRVTFLVTAAQKETGLSVLKSARGFDRTWLRWPEDKLDALIAAHDLPILTDDFAPVDRLMADTLMSSKD